MFPSACSLRSTQCAALIALATAAGISRFEPATESSAADHGPAINSATTSTVTLRATYFQLALKLLAPWLNASPELRRTDSPADSAPSARIPSPEYAGADSAELRSSPPAADVVASIFPPSIAAPCAQRHSFPYAVGPPARENTSQPRADGTFVPCDSAARRSSFLRIALVRFVRSDFDDARLARRDFAGATVARPLSISSAGLPGQPEIPLGSHLASLPPRRRACFRTGLT